MTPRWMLIAFFIFGLVWLTFGILKLTQGETGMGLADLALGIAWLLVAAYRSSRHSDTSRSS